MSSKPFLCTARSSALARLRTYHHSARCITSCVSSSFITKPRHRLRPSRFSTSSPPRMPCRPAISSQSLGRASEHALFPKLKAAAQAGFEGVEIFFEDLCHLANVYTQERLEDHGATEATDAKSSEPNEQDLLRAAEDVRGWCEQFKLDIIALQPLQNFEGHTSPFAHSTSLATLTLFLNLCHALHTTTLLIPSSTLPSSSLSLANITPHLGAAADLAAAYTPPINLAYEALAWGTLVDTWEEAYRHVKEANRSNLGTCIDTFNLAGKVYGDPEASDGKTENADEAFAASLERLRLLGEEEEGREKVFYVQLVDAERLSPPLSSSHPWYDPSQPSRMTWSRNARLFAYEEGRGGYLPIKKIMEVLVREVNFEGWVSMEVFNRELGEEREGLPEEFARRGMKSWEMVKREFGL